MNVDFQSALVTEGKETRLTDNNFHVIKKGYVLYSIDTIIELKRTEQSSPIAHIVIKELQWKDNQTIVRYELKKLISVN